MARQESPEVFRQFAGRRVPARRLLGQALQADRFQGAGIEGWIRVGAGPAPWRMTSWSVSEVVAPRNGGEPVSIS